MRAGWRRLTDLLADSYAVWRARDGALARAAMGLLRRIARVCSYPVGLLGLPFPWLPLEITRADLGEVRALLGQPGCPACRYLAEACARTLFWFLIEGYGEAAWVERLTAAGGFCPHHMWQLADSGLAYRISYVIQYLSEPLNDQLRVLDQALAEGKGDAGRTRRGPLQALEPCPLCTNLERDAVWTIRKIVRCLQDRELATRYAASDGFCWPHLRLAMRGATVAEIGLLAAAYQARLHTVEALLSAPSEEPAVPGVTGPLTAQQRATALLSGWPFHQRRERQHDRWAELEAL